MSGSAVPACVFRKAVQPLGRLAASPVPANQARPSSRARRSARRTRANGPASRRRYSTAAEMWSCKFFPTPGSAAATAMPCSASAAGSPMPDSMRSCGELTTPPARMTSRSARATMRSPPARYSTPIAAVLLDHDARRVRPHRDREIAPRERGPQVRDRGAAAPAAADRVLQQREALLARAVIVVGARKPRRRARCKARRDERIVIAREPGRERAAGAAIVVGAALPRFLAPEIRQQPRIGPVR